MSPGSSPPAADRPGVGPSAYPCLASPALRRGLIQAGGPKRIPTGVRSLAEGERRNDRSREPNQEYGDKAAVDVLMFIVPPGVVTGFLGPNGAGKSTTLLMIAGLDDPTSGWVMVNGRTITAPGPHGRAGPAAGSRGRPPRPLGPRPPAGARPATAAAAARVNEVIELVGFCDVARKRAGGFCLGMGSGGASPRAPRPAPHLIWTSRSTASTRKACCGSAPCSGTPPKAAPSSSPPTYQRDGADRDQPDHHRPGTADRRHQCRGVHRPRLNQRRAGPDARRHPPARPAARPRHHRHQRRIRRPVRYGG